MPREGEGQADGAHPQQEFRYCRCLEKEKAKLMALTHSVK
jgi:hypothetical protein